MSLVIVIVLKDESQTENKWIEKTISQFESNESQKENNNELLVFTQKQEEEQLVVLQSHNFFFSRPILTWPYYPCY
jgi:hypothetical protein